jgi:hypothetical protein
VNAPESSLPSKRELLDFQDRWLRRAGAAALFGAFLVAASLVYQRAGLNLPDANSDADQLAFAHAHSGRLILSSVLQGIGFALFAVPLTFLFRSARGRAERMTNVFMVPIMLGPLLFGLGVGLSSAGSSDAGDKFVKQEPAVVQQARQHATAAQAKPTPAKKDGKAKGAATTTTTPTTATTATTTTAAAKPRTPDQAASDAREGLADHINKHTGLLIAGGVISTLGVLALVVGMVYTSLWSMRVGLLSRFWGAVGMAFGLFLIIPIFPPIPGLVLWFAALGLMFIGVWPRPLPPAWAAGEAIPWPRRDELGPPPADLAPRPDNGPGTVEGSGREVSEPPLPEDDLESETGQAPPEPPYGETQGQRRKKRKRRS